MFTIYFEGRPGDQYNKVAAIKALRLLTRCGLKEAKETIEAAEDSAGVVDLEFDITAIGTDFTSAVNTLKAERFAVKCGHAQLVQALDDALKYAVQERRHAVSRKILEALEELGI